MPKLLLDLNNMGLNFSNMVSNLYKAVASFGTETEERYWDCSLDHYYSCGTQAYI